MERIVHVCSSDSTADTLSLADLPGEIRVWGDTLDQGPLLAVGDTEHYKARGGSADETQRLADWDKGFDEAVRAEELILWFEADISSQFALARLLSRLARRGLPKTLTIVSIDRHPDVPNFVGLAQLKPEQLAELWARRTPLSRDAIDEAITTWIALTSSDPRALPFLMRRVKALPYLAGAIERHLEELPDPTSGMSRTERQLLAAVARGETDLKASVQAIDPRYPITDTLLSHALSTFEQLGFTAGTAITALGRQALAGAIDRVHEHGIETWRGAVHLTGRGPAWRWESRERRLIEK